MKQHEQKWLEHLDKTVGQNLKNPDFRLEDLAKAIPISIAQLHVKVLKLTGLTPKMYIREKRLARANILLEKGVYPTVTEIAAAVGYRHVSYFSTIYEQEYGKKPIEYLR